MNFLGGLQTVKIGMKASKFFLIFRSPELNGYYHITDIPKYDEMRELNGCTRAEYIDAISERIINEAEEIFGYIFRHKNRAMRNEEESLEVSDGISSSEESEDNRTVVAHSTRMYVCSQATTSRSYSKYDREVAVPPEKRRRKVAEPRFDCRGRIQIWIPDGPYGADITTRILRRSVHFSDGEVLLLFKHQCQHPERQRKPLPTSVCEFIINPVNTCRTAAELYRKVFEATQAGSLGNVDMSEITDYNIRYRWLRKERHTYQRDEDPWVSAVSYLREQANVELHSYIHLRRKYFCWYFPKLFEIDLKQVSEVYIDSTYATNGQKAELFGIIACENGYGVAVGYMLMEKKPFEDSVEFKGEVIEACTRFFHHAKELGLYPIIIHTDKCAAEIAAVKV
jgi:hypothetical protein